MEWKNLPRDIIYAILAKYDGRFSVRNGRLMTKIAENDGRKRILERIPPKMEYKTEIIYISYVCLPINTHKQCLISVYEDELRMSYHNIWDDYGMLNEE